MKKLIKGKHIWGHDESVDSFLIQDDEIVSTGDFNDLSSPDIPTEIFDDCLILPGFTDAHLHMNWLGKTLRGCDLRNIKNSKELLSRLKNHTETLSDDELLFGYGYNEQEWEDGTKPTCDLIDMTCGSHPTILTRIDGHSWILNSKLMVMAGIPTISNPDLKKHIQFDKNDKPTGVVFDRVFTDIIQPLLPKDDPDEIKNNILSSQEHLLSLGITSCRSFGSLDVFLTLASMDQDSLLKMRVCSCIPADSLDWAISLATQTGTGSDKFWLGQIKMFADGSLGSRTALVSKPYPDGTLGLEIMTISEIKRVVDKAHKNKLGVAIHAIGDIAVSNAVKALENGDKNDTIEHFQCASPQTISNISKTNVNVVLNPQHIPIDYKAIEREWQGLKKMAYPVASLLVAGISVGFGSDAPVVAADPFYAVACATTRKGANTGTVNPKEAIPFRKAMSIAMEDSAQIIGGPKRGKIENGFKADFSIVKGDFRGKNPWEIPGVKRVATFVGGEKVWVG